MEIDLLIVLGLTLGALVLFVTEKLRVDLIALVVMACLLLTGVLTPAQGLTGFSNEATITIGAMFVLSEGLRQTGSLRRIASSLATLFLRDFRLALLVMMVSVAVVSAFINNVAVVAIMLPVLLSMSRAIGISPSRLLMPLSFAAMFGGTCTLIGTSANLLVSSLMVEHGMEPIGMFEVTPAGLAFFVVGTAYMLIAGRWLLPERERSEEWREAYELGEYRADVAISKGGKLVGKRASEFFEPGTEAQVIGVLRNGVLVAGELEEISLLSEDVVRISAAAHVVQEIDEISDLDVLPLGSGLSEKKESEARELELVEVVISPDSKMDSKTLREAGFERHQPGFVIALRRAGKVVVEDLLDVELHGGDVLLMQVPRDELRRLQESGDFIVVTELETRKFKTHLTVPVIAVLAMVVIVAALGWMPIVTLAVAAAVILILMRALSIEEAYRAIDWQVIFLLGGFIPLGVALEEVGAVDLVATGLVDWLGAFGPLALLAGFYFVSNFMSDVISNQAVAVLMTPVVISTAITMGVDPRPFTIAVAFAASASFASPVGYHTNVMIYSAGNYRYLDFVKIGVPLNLLFLATAMVFIPRVWPF